MEKLADVVRFKARQNILLRGFDPVSAGGFTQVPNFILNEKSLTVGAKLVYAKLLSYAWHNDHVFKGQEAMAEDLGMGRRSVIRFIAELEKRGFLEIKRRGLGRTNIYTLYHTVKRKK